MEPRDNLPPGTLRPGDRLAIERLLDQQELAAQPADLERRAARRLCGRWLMLRRLRRGLSQAEVALRIGIAPELLQLIELGLGASPLADAEVWRRLGLVLEGDARDFQRVAAVIQLALDQGELPDPSWLDALAAELAHDVAASDRQLLPEVERLLRQAAQGQLSRQHVLVLQVLHQAFMHPLTSAEIKLQVDDLGFSFNLADMPRLLSSFQAAHWVERIEGQPAAYRITPGGRRAFALALSGSLAESGNLAQRQLHDLLGGLLSPL